MKKTTFMLLLCVIAAVTAKAQESQTEYNFLRLPVSAHAAALGGDNITIIEDDPSLMFGNPALLSSVSDKTLNLNFMTYMAGALTGSASFNRVVNDKASWGVTAQYVNYGSMKETNSDNIQTGDFTAQELALGGVFSYTLAKNIVGGIGARFMASYIGSYNTLAVGVDLGVNWYDPETEWSVSAVARNLGGQLKAYDEEYGKMPFDMQVGVSKRIKAVPVRLSATMTDLTHWQYSLVNHLQAGVEILLSDQFYIAGGYNFRRAKEMKIADASSADDGGSSHGAGLSFGAGVQLERFKLQASYAKYHVSSSSLLINVSYGL